MKIIYIQRNRNSGISIGKVFEPLIKNVKKEFAVEEYHVPYKGGNPIGIFKNIYFVYKLRKKDCIYHVTGDIHYVILGLIGCKSVLTIHDLVTLEKAKNKLDYFVKWFLWFYLPIKLVSQLVCISNKTKNDLLKVVKKKNISIIHNSVSDSFKFYEITKKNELRVLHIGTGWNKNLILVSKALKNLNCHLRIIGKLSEEQLNVLSILQIDYSNSYSLTDDEIIKEYIDCDIVSFPTIYEGFGMPIIEANAIGRTVITSDIQPHIDIAGDSAILVNPYDLNDLRSKFLLLFNSDEIRNEYIKRGLINVNRFRLEKITSKYISLYKNITL